VLGVLHAAVIEAIQPGTGDRVEPPDSRLAVKVLLNTDCRDIDGVIPYNSLIYTGPIDQYLDFAFGKLPYRSLSFTFETIEESQVQPAAVIRSSRDCSWRNK